MSVIPQEIPEIGSSQLAPRQNPQFSPGPDFTTEDYFVWSRLDGRTSLREVILMVGLGIEKSIGILRKLRRSGALLLPGEDPGAVSERASTAAGAEKSGPHPAEAGPEEPELPDLGELRPDEARTLAEDVALQEREKRRIIQMMRLVAGGDYFAVLEVPRTADTRALRRAYFRLSKEFHPDRHYKQSLGSFGPMLSIIFETATEAFQELSDDQRRAAHIAALAISKPARESRRSGPGADESGSMPASRSTGPQSPRAHEAADFFSRGCDRQVGGDVAGALRMFRAAIKIDPQPRYLRRAAICALAFGLLGEAEAYADKALSMRAGDASYARLRADVLRAAGRLEEAEQTLLLALELPSTSDALTRELQADLAAVRAARAAGSQV